MSMSKIGIWYICAEAQFPHVGTRVCLYSKFVVETIVPLFVEVSTLLKSKYKVYVEWVRASHVCMKLLGCHACRD